MLLQAPTIAQMAVMIGNQSDARPTAISASFPFSSRPRWILHRIKRKIIGVSEKLGDFSPFYESFSRLHAFWCSLLLVRFLYGHKIHIFKQWLDLTGQADNAFELLRLHLMANSWSSGREFFMAQKKVFEKWTRLIGGENIQRAAAAGRGAILVTPHTSIFFPSIKKRLTSQIFPEHYFLGISWLPSDKTTKTFLVAERLKEARDVLARGGAVWIAGDGGGSGPVRKVLTRYGRQFQFRSGAAELAARTGAPLILVFPNLRADGMIEVEFLEPLLPGCKDSRSMCADDLLRQYTKIYVDRWPRMLPYMSALFQGKRLANIPKNEEKNEDL
jgi:hypothetical protein